jgi:hypothetical protein|tara:strand:- start:252 stop:470 length:219 start_codon:yes stop_codon:yes gene_type:complete
MMDTQDQVEKLIVALMVLLKEKGGEYKIESKTFWDMYNSRMSKGIQVQELENDGILLKMGDMNVSPDDALNN